MRFASQSYSSRCGALSYLPEIHSDEETRDWIADVVLKTCEVWVGLSVGEVTGFVAVNDNILEHLYVLPKYQSAGVGNALLFKAKELSAGRSGPFGGTSAPAGSTKTEDSRPSSSPTGAGTKRLNQTFATSGI